MCCHLKTNRVELSPTKRAQIYTRYLDGRSVPEIVRLEKVKRETVRDIIQRGNKDGRKSFYTKPGRGRKKKTSNRDDRALVRAASKDIRATLFALSTPSKSTKKLGRNTVRKILKSAGKAKRRPRRKPFLKEEHKKARKEWCREQKKLGRDWHKVCWSDEVTFEVGANGSVFYVTRGAGEEYLDKNLKPSFKSGRTSVGVWSCYCGDEMGPLVMLEKGERMTAARYKATLEEHFIPFYEEMVEKCGPDVVMQEDNAPWHKAKLVRNFLRKKKVKYIHWPV